ncbi:glucose/ribitol dehydrogenase [Tanacetum coccineum]
MSFLCVNPHRGDRRIIRMWLQCNPMLHYEASIRLAPDLKVGVFIIRMAGKVVITGRARGIGESIARSRNGSYIHCDVCIELNIENAINFAVKKHGKLDNMINNAAIIGHPKLSILENEKSVFERVMSVNVTGVFLGTKHAAHVMIPACSGSIISIVSVSLTIGGVVDHAYTCSKHALVGLNKNVDAELEVFGIRVNCISPYFIPTSMGTFVSKNHLDLFSNVYSKLIGMVLQVDDVADATLFLASDESKYISGHNLALDGGFTTINPSFVELS